MLSEVTTTIILFMYPWLEFRVGGIVSSAHSNNGNLESMQGLVSMKGLLRTRSSQLNPSISPRLFCSPSCKGGVKLDGSFEDWFLCLGSKAQKMSLLMPAYMQV